MSYNMFCNLPGIGFSLEDAAPATAGAHLSDMFQNINML